MPNVFDGTADKSFMMLSVREPNTEQRPTPEEMEEIDQAVADLYNFALRSGGGLEAAVPQYAVGYILPKGATIRLNQEEIVEKLSRCSYFDNEAFVTLTPISPTEEEIERTELVGTPPSESLSGLQSFADDLNDEWSD